MNLVIVESPTKAKTIGKFLGKNYRVLSSYGHIRDLPKSNLGVDVENEFKPKYVIPSKSKKVIKILKEEAKKSNQVILATDEDREGEAISWHLVEALELEKKKGKSKKYQRITFHEITKEAIKEALKNPRALDLNLVDAQQARRILDRIVGYKLSPFLWKKVARGLSAGRVQSVTVRLVVEREREIQSFRPQEYWTIAAFLKKLKEELNFEALLIKKDNKTIPKLGIKNKEATEKLVSNLKDSSYQVKEIEKTEVKRNPFPPFNTSSLQQEAWKRFGFPAKLTMALAQQLYEKGHTTYHRTDSLNLSNQSLFGAKKFIEEKYGKKYWVGYLRRYKSKGRTQEAHEAIRPTYPSRMPESIKLETNLLKLYGLIWQRFIACQMAQALFDSTAADIAAMGKDKKEYLFRANGQILKFDGFLKVYPMKFEEKELPTLEKKEALILDKLLPNQHFTQPPARYTEASLIKALEENGIGRPSTYAPILSNIQERNYIEKNEQKRFQPTEIGIVVNDLLVSNFPNIVDIGFTAQMENELDQIAEGEKKWVPVLQEFYKPFEENLKQKYQEVSKKEIAEEKTDKVCPKCNSPLILKLGKFGKFYACSSFPKCRYTESLKDNGLDISCPKCQKGEIVEKRTKKKKIFYGCNQFPSCYFALWDKPIKETCPKCKSLLVKTKRGQIKCSNKSCDFKK